MVLAALEVAVDEGIRGRPAKTSSDAATDSASDVPAGTPSDFPAGTPEAVTSPPDRYVVPEVTVTGARVGAGE